MAQPESSERNGFRVTTKVFTNPRNAASLDPVAKRKITICNRYLENVRRDHEDLGRGGGWCVAMAAASPPNFPSSSWPAIKPGDDLPIDTAGSSCDLSRIYLRAALESMNPPE